MQTTLETPQVAVAVRLEVLAETWTKYLKLKAEKNALQKQVDLIEESFNFPTAEQIGEKKTLVIHNGNGDEVGKLSCFWFSGATIDPAWRRRIS